MKFSIAILQRGTNTLVQCFEEVAAAFAGALRDLGHDVVDFNEGGRLILFGAGSAIPVENTVPDGSIIFNAEQLTPFGGNVWRQMSNFNEWAKRCIVWDYSEVNATKLREAGATVVHCPIGYHPRMRFIESAPEPDVDVLFYGSLNPRRKEILNELEAAGVDVKYLFNVFGRERDMWIGRSKIVLNLHYYDKGIFEIFRVSHLVANGKCVVSEGGGTDPRLEKVARQITDLVEREEIVPAVRDLLKRPVLRNDLAMTAQRAFERMPLVESIRDALKQS